MLLQMCEAMDENVTSQLYKVGGANYTTLASLSWRLVLKGMERERGRERERENIVPSYERMYYFRQAVGATVTVWNDVIQEPWMFMKEISSDGDVSTVSEMEYGNVTG